MEKQTLLNSINRSMLLSAAQVRFSLGRTLYATMREKSLEAGSNVGTGKASLPNWEINDMLSQKSNFRKRSFPCYRKWGDVD